MTECGTRHPDYPKPLISGNTGYWPRCERPFDHEGPHLTQMGDTSLYVWYDEGEF